MEKQTFSPVQCEMNACASDVHSFQASVMRVRVDALFLFTPHMPQATSLPLYVGLAFESSTLRISKFGPGQKREFGFDCDDHHRLRQPPRTPKQHIKMADRGGFASRGGAERGGDRGRGRGGRRGPRRGAKSEEKEWQPVTKLGRLVKAGKIKSMEEIYLHSLPIKEYQIVDFFLPALKDEVMKVRHSRKKPGRNANGRT